MLYLPEREATNMNYSDNHNQDSDASDNIAYQQCHKHSFSNSDNKKHHHIYNIHIGDDDISVRDLKLNIYQRPNFCRRG